MKRFFLRLKQLVNAIKLAIRPLPAWFKAILFVQSAVAPVLMLLQLKILAAMVTFHGDFLGKLSLAKASNASPEQLALYRAGETLIATFFDSWVFELSLLIICGLTLFGVLVLKSFFVREIVEETIEAPTEESVQLPHDQDADFAKEQAPRP